MILITINHSHYVPATESSSSGPRVGSREEERKDRSLRSEIAGLRLRCECGAGLRDGGVLGPEVRQQLER